MATTCAQCGVPMHLWAGKLECFGVDCCTTGAAVVALGQSIRSFARRARVDKLHTILFMGLDDRCGQREFAALTELATLAKEGA
jgi:hypothetical protein